MGYFVPLINSKITRSTMSCVLRIIGENLNVEELLKIDSNPDTYWKKGDSKLRTRPNNKKHLRSGAHYCVSEAEFNEFEKQKKDVIKYLHENEEKIKAIQKLAGIESVFLDFGIEQRDVFVQSDFFQPELIRLAGKLGLGIKLSQYPPSDE